MEIPPDFHPPDIPSPTSTNPAATDSPTTSARIPSAPPAHAPVTEEIKGHTPHGRTIAVHSVCVLPTHQNMGLGKTLVKAYLQRMEGSGIADRVALIAKPELVGWYVGRFGFQERGESKVGFGGGGWRDLVSFLFLFFWLL